MKLLISQKDHIFDLLEKAGLSPSQFELSESSSQVASGQIATILSYKGTDYFFSFETGQKSESSHYSIYCPGIDSYIQRNYPGDWSNQLYYFETWISTVSKELTAPNKWERLKKEIAEIKFGFKEEEGKFSVQEFEDLRSKIVDLKSSIESVGLTNEQLTAINNRLDHLTELAKEMNKYDWKGLFIGTIISMVIQLGVTQDNARSLWTLIKQIFSNYLLL